MNRAVNICGLLLVAAVVAGIVVAVTIGSSGQPSATTDSAKVVPATSEQPTDDWPLYRGGSRFNGVAAGSLPESLQLLWTFETEHPIKSSAIIVGERVYIGGDDGHIYALDAHTGDLIWKFKTDGPIEAPPMYVDGVIYIGSWDAFFYALDAETGQQRWRYETGSKIAGSANYSRRDNGELWIIVGSYDSVLHCVRATDGAPVWTYETDDYINGAPAVAGERIVFGGCDTNLHMVDVNTGRMIKKVEVGSQIAATVALDGGVAFIGHYGNEFLAVELDDGQPIWTARDRKFPFMSSAAVTDDVVVIGTRGRRVLCLDRGDGSRRWEFRSRGGVDSSPVICGDKVVVGSEGGRLYLLRLSDGHELWHYDVGQALIASPAVAHGIVVIGSDDGNVYAFAGKSAAQEGE